MKQAKEKKTGRKTKMTPETINKLDEAFAMGCTDLEACLLAGITPPTLYDYQNDNPDYKIRKELLKTNPIALARKSVVKAVPRDPELALKFLERVKKDEFSLRTEHTGLNGSPIEITIKEE